MDKKTMIVVGAGQGLGNHVAERFGREAYRVVLMARNAESLEKYKAWLTAAGIEAHVHTADAAKPETLTEAIRALAIALHDELKPRGIHVGTLTVFGSIGIDSYMSPARIADTVWQMNLQRDVCEVKYEYPEMQGGAQTAAEYWTKVYALAEKYK